MEISWLEDFLALVEEGNFSRAAQKRNMSQPTLSRRIMALESWLGASLFIRETHRLELTPSAEVFRTHAYEILRRINVAQVEAQEIAGAQRSILRMAATHVLSLTFFPMWLSTLNPPFDGGTISLVADHMMGCEQLMLEGRAHFLLHHHHAAVSNRLGLKQFPSVLVGSDRLVPVSAPREDGEPLYALPGSEDEPLPFLAYGEESGLGRILKAAREADGPPAWLAPVFISPISFVLRAISRRGRGVTWLPLALLRDDMARKTLVRAGGPEWDIPMEIRISRPRQRQSPAAESLWAAVKDLTTPGVQT